MALQLTENQVNWLLDNTFSDMTAFPTSDYALACGIKLVLQSQLTESPLALNADMLNYLIDNTFGDLEQWPSEFLELAEGILTVLNSQKDAL